MPNDTTTPAKDTINVGTPNTPAVTTTIPLPQDPDTEIVTLDTPITRGDMTISQFVIRKPKTSSLRGESLAKLMAFEIDTMAKVIPRITTPTIVEHELMGLDLSDLVKVSSAVASFFTSPAERAKARLAEQADEPKTSSTPTVLMT